MTERERRELWLSSDADGAVLDIPEMVRLFGYWKSAARGKPAPRRDEIDPPIDMPDYLPTTIMFDVDRSDEGGPKFRYRLIGTRLVEVVGRDLKGETLEGYFGVEAAAADIAIYREVVESCRCYFGRRISMIERRKIFEWYQRLVMPVLGNESGRVDQIWTWIKYERHSKTPM